MLWEQLDPTDQDLLASVDETPTGPLQVAAAESALAELRSRGSFAAEALGRMARVEAGHYVPAEPSMLTHMAWLRQVVDHPEIQADQQQRLRLHWMLKWAPSAMLSLPQLSLADVDEAVDDLENVFRRSGFALRPVLGFRARIARERGDEDAVRRAMAQWVAEPRDELSDCLACDTSGQGLVWERVDPARAREAWRPLFEGGQQCLEEPQVAQSHDAVLQLAAGDADAALAQVRAAWRRSQAEARHSDAAAHCLVAWTRMGNLDRALPALLDRLDWLDQLITPRERMVWTSAATLVLDAAAAAGCAPETVGGQPLAAQREEWHRTAAELAHAFDARNGTSYYTDRLRDWLDLDRVATSPHAPPTALAPSGRGAPPRPGSISGHAADLLAELESFGAGVRPLLSAWVHHRDSLLATAQPQDEEHVAFLDRLAASESDRPDVLLDRAEQAARAGGGPADVLRVEAERLSLLGDDGPDRLARLVEIAEELDRSGAHRDASAVWRTASRHAESWEESETLCLRAAESSAAQGEPARQGLALLEAARWAGGEPDRSAAHLAAARPLLAEHPRLRLLADEIEARLLAAAGRLDDAVELLERALSAVHEPDIAISVRFFLCDLLVDLDRYEDLLAVSERALTDAASLDDPLVLAVAQRFHGLALFETGRPAEALELLDAAVPTITERAPELVGPLRWAHANALTVLGESAPARVSYAAASTAFEAQERFHEAAHAQLQAGNRAWDVDDLDAAEAHFDASADFAATMQDAALYVEAIRSRATVRALSGTLPDLAELDGVIDDVTSRMQSWDVPDDALDLGAVRARLLRDGANLFADTGRFEEAAIRMREAERVWPDESGTWLLRAERGIFLARLGRLTEAEELLRPALTGMEADHWPDMRLRLVQRWATALDEAGRTDEADRVWQELGPQE